MNFIAAVIAGVVGTFAMFAFILVSPLIVGVPKINIYDYMGTLFTKEPQYARIIGFALLSFDGAVLAIISVFLWEIGVGSPTWYWGLIFGAVFGVLSILFMFVTFRIHPRLPDRQPWPIWVVVLSLWLGHLVYGLVMVLIYSGLS